MRRRLSTKKERIAWIAARPEMWAGMPTYDTQARTGDYWSRKAAIVEAMKADGLLSQKTGVVDVDVLGLIREARKQRRERQGG